jgi:hypothetical protein
MAVAITSATGVLTHGSTLTIAGTGFGTKTTAAPLKFDNFEAGTPGENVTGWGTDVSEGYGRIKYSTAVSRGVGSVVSLFPFTPDYYNISLQVNGTFSVVYLDFWVYLDRIDTVSRNWKMCRLWASDHNLSCVHCRYDNRDAGVDYLYDAGATPEEFLIEDEFDTISGEHEWLHVQFAHKQSAVNVADGALLSWENCQQRCNRQNVVTRQHDRVFSMIRIGHYWACDLPYNSGANIYFDDVYVDTTFARVEIGNAATYAACTHREIQIPTAWSSTECAVALNRGSFATLPGLYLYVIDSDGVVNADGYELEAEEEAPPETSRVIFGIRK